MHSKASNIKPSTTTKNPKNNQSVNQTAHNFEYKNVSKNKNTEKESTQNIDISMYYEIGEALGEGTFSVVKLSRHLISQENVAIKILKKSRIKNKEDYDRIVREIKILKKIRHPHLIQLYEIHEAEKELFFVMEQANGGELYDYIVKNERIPEAEACHIFYQLICAIEYLESISVAHRDIKPENILLDSKNDIKLIDFGLGRLYNRNEDLVTACGSPCYAAPEMVARKTYNGTMVDIWSSGVTLFAMLCGHLPFDDDDLSTLYTKILAGAYEFTVKLSDEAMDLLQKILVTDPTQRYNVKDIKNHPWMRLRFLHRMPKRNIVTDIPIDYAIIDKISSYGIEKEVILTHISENRHNMLTTTYYLLLKQGYKGEALEKKELYFDELIQQSREELADKLEAKLKERETEGKGQNQKSSVVRKMIIRKIRQSNQDQSLNQQFLQKKNQVDDQSVQQTENLDDEGRYFIFY